MPGFASKPGTGLLPSRGSPPPAVLLATPCPARFCRHWQRGTQPSLGSLLPVPHGQERIRQNKAAKWSAKKRCHQINPEYSFREKSLMVVSYDDSTNRRIAKKCSGGCRTGQTRVGPKALAWTQRSFYLYLFFSVGLSNRHVSANTRERLLINSSAGICPLEKTTHSCQKSIWYNFGCRIYYMRNWSQERGSGSHWDFIRSSHSSSLFQLHIVSSGKRLQ